MSVEAILGMYFGGLALIATEAFMPGLVLGLTGLALVGVSAYHALTVHVWLGIGEIVVTLAFVPFVIYVGIRQLSLKRTLGTGEGVTSVGEDYTRLVGKTGAAATSLRPAGTVTIDQVRYDVVTEGDLIEMGTTVRVIKVEGNRIVVKKA